MPVMARPREFDRDVALAGAIATFAGQGYEGTSTDILLKRMGIGRQSLYDTFGDKRRLYLEALRSYCRASTTEMIDLLNSHPSARAGLEAALLAFAARPASLPEHGCLGVGAICEFGISDPDVSAIVAASGAILLSAFAAAVEQGKAAGEFPADLVPEAAAHFLAATLTGLKVTARGGAGTEVLRNIVRMALRSLT
ncbi:TetR/AcrR family transcriptional regulator [Sphingomonas sp.]|uniref:TetR/AcrR family transcriptional regulator n=1 Tax=Sphingomonas sp. TaxID=28214 RepID=UPI003D6C7860